MPQIFISYSRADQDFGRQLATALSDMGADVWIDVEDIPAGMKWSSAIAQGLDQSDMMLVIISPDAMDSANVEDEWQYFLDQKKPVIPIYHRPAKIHFQLNRLQYVDFNKQPFDHALAQLHRELQRQGIRLAAPPQPAPDAEPRPQGATQISPPQRRNLQGMAIGGVLLLIIVGALAIFALGNNPDDPNPSPSPTDIPPERSPAEILAEVDFTNVESSFSGLLETYFAANTLDEVLVYVCESAYDNPALPNEAALQSYQTMQLIDIDALGTTFDIDGDIARINITGTMRIFSSDGEIVEMDVTALTAIGSQIGAETLIFTRQDDGRWLLCEEDAPPPETPTEEPDAESGQNDRANNILGALDNPTRADSVTDALQGAGTAD